MDDVVRNWIEYVLSETRPRLREREDEFFLLGWETKFFFSLGGWGGGGDGDIVDALGGQDGCEVNVVACGSVGRRCESVAVRVGKDDV
jgi:hypothetical protein